MQHSSKSTVTIIIPNWNGKKYLGKCLLSISAQTLLPDKVIIVDNGSVDGSLDAPTPPGLVVDTICLDRNYGFAKAVNEGIKAASTDYIVLLNNDTEQDKDWLKNLAAQLDLHPEYDSASSKLLHFDRRSMINTAGDGVSVYGLAFAVGTDKVDSPEYKQQKEIFGASAGASMYRQDFFKQVGLFDERFFAYVEDVDLCFRAQLLGKKCLFVPTARIYHHVGGTSSGISGFGQYYTTRNTTLMVLKNFPGKLLLKYSPKLLLGQAIWTLHGRHPKHYYYTFKGYFSALLSLPYILKERRKVQKNRVSSVHYIDSILLHKFPYPTRIIDVLKKLHLVKG